MVENKDCGVVKAPQSLFRGNKLLYNLELVFAYTAERANPIFRYIFKGGAWRYATVGIAYLRVVNPITYCTTILFHFVICFKVKHNIFVATIVLLCVTMHAAEEKVYTEIGYQHR